MICQSDIVWLWENKQNELISVWIVSWLIESVMIRRYIVRGFAYCLNGNDDWFESI